MRNILIEIEYDGTEYHGWQVQPNGITIQAVLQDRLSQILQEPVTVVGSGRTDAGVHARCQVANFHTASSLPCGNMQKAMNALLPGDIALTKVQEVPSAFHARFSAKSKVYRYQIYNSVTKPALLRRYVWHIRRSLDIASMNDSVRHLVGTYDYSSFCGSGDHCRTHERTVMTAAFRQEGDDPLVVFTIEADGFLRHMVRNIVGTAVEAGVGVLAPEELPAIRDKQDRTAAGPTAPPQGLFLEKVIY